MGMLENSDAAGKTQRLKVDNRAPITPDELEVIEKRAARIRARVAMNNAFPLRIPTTDEAVSELVDERVDVKN